MAKTTKRARSVKPAATVAASSAPITAANVWEFRNPEEVQASNRLVGGTISDTLESVTCVLALLSDYHARNSGSELSRTVEDGLCSVIDWVLDAVEKQSKQLEVNHG